ncbi:unnamed protein product [Rhodiola kirilowii]
MVNDIQKAALIMGLGIPVIYVVHGHINVYKVTVFVFAHIVCLGVTWDLRLDKRIGVATALVVRAIGIPSDLR